MDTIKSKKLDRLEFTYQKLLLALDQVEELLGKQLARDHRISCAILVDDVMELITECEAYLVDGIQPEDIEEESFETRAEVVIEDTEQLSRVIANIVEYRSI